jgi:hypothetical protein
VIASDRRSHVPSERSLAFVVLAATPLAIATWVPGRAQVKIPDTDDPTAFQHRKHVPEEWRTRRGGVFRYEELARDCRGCHAYDTGRQHDPQSVCTRCHVATPFERSAPPGYEDTLAPLRHPENLFRHDEHLRLACRTCHAPTENDIADPVPIRRGVAECARCHTAGAQTRIEMLAETGLAASNWAAKFTTEINDAPRMRREDRIPFRHTDHIDPTHAKSGAADCASCHADVHSSDAAGLGGRVWTQAACRECHRTQIDAVQFVAEMRDSNSSGRFESHSALTFSHADHLRTSRTTPLDRICDPTTATGLKQQSCAACHVFQDTPLDAATPLTYVVKSVTNGGVEHARSSYEGCLDCHTLHSWATKPGLHGTAWSDCTQCHMFGKDAAGRELPTKDMGRARATVVVDRPRTGLIFAMPSQVHPGITVDRGQACEQCHRARPDKLPSRTGEKPFNHASHLTPNPTAGECASCHGPKIDGARTPQDIGKSFDGAAIDAAHADQLDRSYDPGVCARCHPGIVVAKVEGQHAPQRRVLNFSHAEHLHPDANKRMRKAPGGDAITCLTCHRPDSNNANNLIGILKSAEDCTLCHQHDMKELYRNTGDVDGDQVKSCVRCHASVVPPIGEPIYTTRATIVRVVGAQHHPDDPRCFTCHQESDLHVSPHDPVDARFDVAWPLVRGKWGTPVNGRAPPTAVHADRRYLDDDSIACHGCHWHDARIRSPVDEKQTSSDEKVHPGLRNRRTADGRRIGNILDAYPGLEIRKDE